MQYHSISPPPPPKPTSLRLATINMGKYTSMNDIRAALGGTGKDQKRLEEQVKRLMISNDLVDCALRTETEKKEFANHLGVILDKLPTSIKTKHDANSESFWEAFRAFSLNIKNKLRKEGPSLSLKQKGQNSREESCFETDPPKRPGYIRDCVMEVHSENNPESYGRFALSQFLDDPNECEDGEVPAKHLSFECWKQALKDQCQFDENSMSLIYIASLGDKDQEVYISSQAQWAFAIMEMSEKSTVTFRIEKKPQGMYVTGNQGDQTQILITSYSLRYKTAA